MVLTLMGGLAAQMPGTAASPANPPPVLATMAVFPVPGFCATVFADNLGHVRHLVAAPDGTIYANTWSGRYSSRPRCPADI
jgi:hypothetical protein